MYSLQQEAFFTFTTAQYSSTSLPITHSVQYSVAMGSAPVNLILGISSFFSEVSNDFSPNITASNITVSSFIYSFEVFGDTVIDLFRYNYMAFGSTADFAEVYYDCRLCQNISQGTGDRTESFTGITQFIVSNLSVQVFLSGFQLHNSDGLNNFLEFTARIQDNTQTIQYSLKTSENNTVQSICFSTLVYADSVALQHYYYWVQHGTYAITQTQDTSIITPDIRYHTTNRVFFGITGFNVSRTTARYFSFGPDHWNDYTVGYYNNLGMHLVSLGYFYIAQRQCGNNQYFDVPTQTCRSKTACSSGTYPTDTYFFCSGCHYSCSTCDGGLDTNCTACLSQHFRIAIASNQSCGCIAGYLDVGVSLCMPCSTLIPGCDTCFNATLCSACKSGFIPDSNGNCSCSSGFLASGICVDTIGCVSAVQYSGTIYCISCNETLNFVRTDTFTCSCQTGFSLNSSVCQFHCGDGIIVSGQECDDGNLNDGDGCSSSCTIETTYSCVNNPAPSVCKLVVTPILTLKSVTRDIQDNKMEILIGIEPLYDFYSSMEFQSLISHDFPSSEISASYSDGNIRLIVPYTQTIEGKNFSMMLSLDPDFFSNLSSNTSLAIPAFGSNAKLTYDSETVLKSNSILPIIFTVLSCLALLLTVLSLFSERMIGLETVQTFQTILYAVPMMGTCPSTLAPLEYLRYSNGYNFISGNDFYRTYRTGFALSSIGIQNQFLLSFNLMFILILMALAAVVIAKIIVTAQKINVETNHKARQTKRLTLKQATKSQKVFAFVFERVFWLMVFLSMFTIVFAIAAQLSELTSTYYLVDMQLNVAGAILALTILWSMLALVIVNGVLPVIGLLSFQDIKVHYPSIYLVYQSIFIVIAALLYSSSYGIFILVGMVLVHIIFVGILQPYPEKIHIAAIFINQLTIEFSLGVFTYAKLAQNGASEIVLQIACYLILAALSFILLLSFYRLWRWRSYLAEKYPTSRNEMKEEDLMKERLQIQNRNKSKVIVNHDDIMEMQQIIPINKMTQRQEEAKTEKNENQFQQSEHSDRKIKKEKPESHDDNQSALLEEQKEIDPLQLIKRQLRREYVQKNNSRM